MQRAGGPLASQLPVALVIELVGLHLGAQAGHLRPQLGLVKHQQQLARPHHVALAHQQPLDPPAGLGRQVDFGRSLKGAQRVETGLEGSGPNPLTLDLGQPLCRPILGPAPPQQGGDQPSPQRQRAGYGANRSHWPSVSPAGR